MLLCMEDSTASAATKLLLTYAEAGTLLSVSEKTVKRMVDRGELRPVEIGRCRRLAMVELDRWVNEKTAGDAHPAVSRKGGPTPCPTDSTPDRAF